MKWVLRVGLLVALLFIALDADARVGGGQGFGTGGGGGGFSGGDGGDDVIGILLYIALELCFTYPEIGVPLLIIVLIIAALRIWWMSRQEERQVHRLGQTRQRVRKAAIRPPTKGIGALVARDPAFSEHAFKPFAQLVHRRGLTAAASGDYSALTPFIAESAQHLLARAVGGAEAVRNVVHASTVITGVEQSGGRDALTVRFTTSRLVTRDGQERPQYTEETWRFERDAGTTSLPPEDTLRLGCPSCGVAVQTDLQGQCSFCGTPVTAGQLQWQVTHARVDIRRPFTPPSVSRFAGGDEPGVHVPTVVDPELPSAYRRFLGEHADFDQAAFVDRGKGIFVELQAAWSSMDWDRARPYVSDTLYETLRFQIEQYAQAGLSNRVDRLQIERTDLVRIQQDAWYDAITLRFWASSLDWVEDADGRVVGGNAKVQRRFSEYWTFLRATGSGASANAVGQCPSCGAALDRVNAAGVCGYCDSRIVSGQFDWVLTRIDQPQVYEG